MSKFVICTDAGLDSKTNRRTNDFEKRAFVVTPSIKKLKIAQKEYVFNTEYWEYPGFVSLQTIDVSKIYTEKDSNTVFYKEQWID